MANLLMAQVAFALLCATVTAVTASTGTGETALPAYPGKQAFIKVDDYLKKNVKSNSVAANIDSLVGLLGKLTISKVKATSVKNVIELILELDSLASSSKKRACKCDAYASQLLDLTVRGVLELSDDVAKGGEASQGKTIGAPEQRMAAMVRGALSKIAAECEPGVEHRLAQAIGSIYDASGEEGRSVVDNYNLLLEYLTPGFIEEWRDKFERYSKHGLAYGRMSASANWTDWQMVKGQTMLVGTLLEVAKQDLADWNNSYSVYQEYTSYKWPKINQRKLKAIMKKFILVPCKQFLELTDLPVFRLPHLAVRHLGPDYGLKFLANRTDDFKSSLFRYEFCQFNSDPQALYNELWQTYRKAVYPNMIFTPCNMPFKMHTTSRSEH